MSGLMPKRCGQSKTKLAIGNTAGFKKNVGIAAKPPLRLKRPAPTEEFFFKKISNLVEQKKSFLITTKTGDIMLFEPGATVRPCSLSGWAFKRTAVRLEFPNIKKVNPAEEMIF
jgi:hypothetical protein